MFRHCVLVTAVLLTAAAAAAQPSIGKEFQLKVGESATVGPEGLTVGFDGILNDSRCATGVLCIWEGDAAAGIWAQLLPSERKEFVLHSHRGFVWNVSYQNYEIALIAVVPYPVVDDPIPPEEYVVTILVSGGPAPVGDSTWGRIKALYGARE